VRSRDGVWAWDLPEKPPKEAIDAEYYLVLLQRAAETVLAPFNAVPTQARAFSFATEGTRMEQASEKELVYGNP
jgi:hypothetical protein